jgi:hypothetical protein
MRSISFAAIVSSAAAAGPCDDNLNAAVSSLRSVRLELERLEGAPVDQVCEALGRYLEVLAAARIVFDQCLTGALRTEMVRDADASLARVSPGFRASCAG